MRKHFVVVAPAAAALLALTLAAAPADKHIKWESTFPWLGWEDGLAAARESGKPICLLVYTNWCPHCKALAPVFRDPAVAEAAKGLVMVLQDSDEKPAWLAQRFGSTGSYIPRVLFLDSEGNLLAELTSGHPKYPYFYWPGTAERLKANMKAALAAQEEKAGKAKKAGGGE